ncbi:MAG TPA: TlpA disulfide reductase family protein [Gemmatimonadaceae bacterium]|nr:TlpA disulfide reductase family protein [Gemmatimonadaceae bacterium]
MSSLLVAAACLPADHSPAAIGRPAPAYAARSLAGDSVSLAAHAGEVVLLNVWATWCLPCRDEIPALQRLHERHQADGLRIVGVSVDSHADGERIGAFARDFGVTYAIWLDPDDRVAQTFLTVGVPTTFLIGRDGTLLWRHTGPVRDDDPALLALLGRALADRPGAE